MQTAISALQSVLQEDFKATEIEVLMFPFIMFNNYWIRITENGKMLMVNILIYSQSKIPEDQLEKLALHHVFPPLMVFPCFPWDL